MALLPKFPFNLVAVLFSAATLITSGPVYSGQSERWILVDTRLQKLFVKRDDEIIKTYDIAIGQSGAKRYRYQDDGTTPLGNFEIAWISTESQFHIFFGLNYPNLKRAERAYFNKEIDRKTFYRIKDSLTLGEIPPQTTKLGGYIGIHGLGGKDIAIHEEYNWTQGCVALTNREIEELYSWVDVGTEVIIR